MEQCRVEYDITRIQIETNQTIRIKPSQLYLGTTKPLGFGYRASRLEIQICLNFRSLKPHFPLSFFSVCNVFVLWCHYRHRHLTFGHFPDIMQN